MLADTALDGKFQHECASSEVGGTGPHSLAAVGPRSPVWVYGGWLAHAVVMSHASSDGRGVFHRTYLGLRGRAMWGVGLAAISIALLAGYAMTHWLALILVAGFALFFRLAWKTK